MVKLAKTFDTFDNDFIKQISTNKYCHIFRKNTLLIGRDCRKAIFVRKTGKIK